MQPDSSTSTGAVGAGAGGALVEIRTSTFSRRPPLTAITSSTDGAPAHLAAAPLSGSGGGTWPLKRTSPWMLPGPVGGGVGVTATAADASAGLLPAGPSLDS